MTQQFHRRCGSIALTILSIFLAACSGGGSAAPGQPPAPPPPPPPPTAFVPLTSFSDVSGSSGIAHAFSIVKAGTGEPAQIGGGVAAADFDGDDDIDLYFVGGDGAVNALYRNDGANQFSDIAAGINLDVSHLGSGPAFADIDGDDDLDLFVGAVEGDSFYVFRNDAGQFTDVTGVSGIMLTADNTMSASFADYDGDNDLDLFLAHWGNDAAPDTETLWQNNGDGSFVSASVQSNIADQLTEDGGLPGLFDYSFAPVFSDIDRDRDLDILLSADFGTSKVFENNGDGTFTNITDRNVVIDRNGMGGVAGDYDNDGDIDWLVTSIFNTSSAAPNPGNRLYRNEGNNVFADVTDAAGVADGGWGWAACMEDFDNDGDLDIFHTNGWERVDPRDAGGTNDFTFDQVRYFESQGDGTFVSAATEAGLVDTGQGRGVACFDSDRDGDIDLLITNNQATESTVLYRNDYSGTNHFLTVRLNGNTLNTAAIGAMVEVTDGNRTQIREVRANSQFASQSPAEAHFGLNDATNVDITVFWPNGGQTVLTDVAADQLFTIDQT